MKTFGQLLSNYKVQYKNSKSNLDLLSYCTTSNKLEELTSCCKRYNIDFDKFKILEFLKNLIQIDPELRSLDTPKNAVEYQESGSPYPFYIDDFDKYKDTQLINDTEFVFENRNRKKKHKVRPKCINDNCNKSAYFGLPFCPWCMRQIPPYYPKMKKHHMRSSVLPIIDMDDINSNPCTGETVTKVIAGVKKQFNLSDIVIEDKNVKVTYGDVEEAKKVIKNYIP